MSDAPAQQKDLRAYLRPVLRRWWLIVLVVPVVTVGTYLYYDHKPKTYQSSTELYFQPSTLQQLVFGTKSEAQSKIENYALLIQTAAVGERAEANLAKELGKDNVPAGGVAAQGIEQTSFIVITATAADPVAAADLANAYATAFIELQSRQVRREAKRAAQAAEKQLAGIKKTRSTVRRREGIEQQIAELQLVAGQPQSESGIKQVEPAVPIPVALNHDPKGNAIFAFVVALMLAVGGAYGLEYLNRRITRIEDVEEIYELPVLTEIPQVGKPAPAEQSGIAMAKMLHGPFHRLQANLELLARERPIRTILVASAAPGEGKSIVARNLGLAYREAGRNVAVVDADFRKASLGRLLDAEEGLGLSDILAGRASFGQVVQEVRVQSTTNGDNGWNGNGNGVDWRPYQSGAVATKPRDGELAMVPAGEHHGNLSSAFASSEMRDALTAAVNAYGMVIIDSPPLLAVADALPLLSEVDAVILVTRLGVSTRDSARRLLSELERVPDVNVGGVVINGISRRVYRARSYGYYDG